MAKISHDPVEMPKPCPKCHKNRWKTLEKGRRYQCLGVTYRQGQEPVPAAGICESGSPNQGPREGVEDFYRRRGR